MSLQDNFKKFVRRKFPRELLCSVWWLSLAESLP